MGDCLTPGFNSRTRVGATWLFALSTDLLVVSIHAPVWVRLVPIMACPCMIKFQFTHPCGCDAERWHIILIPLQFQFTHPCGCDLRWMNLTWCACGFQFTHPCGCDIPTVLVGIPCSGFNSRTRVGATPSITIPIGIVGVSIHAPVWVRRVGNRTARLIASFQFTHPCGCDIH